MYIKKNPDTNGGRWSIIHREQDNAIMYYYYFHFKSEINHFIQKQGLI